MSGIKANIKFSDVDQNPKTQHLLNHQDLLNANESIQIQKRKTYKLMEIGPNDKVLDAGCGLGDDVCAMAERVGDQGCVYGICNSEAMIEAAKKRFKGSRVRFSTQDISQLDFPDDFFDSVRADRVFIHLDNPKLALAEMVRVLKPGGYIVINEPDFRSFLFASHFCSYQLNAQYINHLCASVPNPQAAFDLQFLFADHAELQKTSVHSYGLSFYGGKATEEIFMLNATLESMKNEGLIEAQEGEKWLKAVSQFEAPDILIATAIQLATVGQKHQAAVL